MTLHQLLNFRSYYTTYDDGTSLLNKLHWDGSPQLTDPFHKHETAYRAYLASKQRKVEMKGITDPDWSDA